MPNLRTHIQQAELNEEAALYNKHEYRHVAIIMCFYAALQYVEAYAVWRGDNIYELHRDLPTQHDRYESYLVDIGMDNNCDDLSIAYGRLREASNTARYLKHIKQRNRTTEQQFIDKDAGFYIEKLQVIKAGLQVNSMKASIED